MIIWDKDMTLKDAGGPSGYLFNLKQYLTLHPTPQITFYSDFVPPQETPDSGSYKVKGLKGRLKETAIGKHLPYGSLRVTNKDGIPVYGMMPFSEF